MNLDSIIRNCPSLEEDRPIFPSVKEQSIITISGPVLQDEPPTEKKKKDTTLDAISKKSNPQTQIFLTSLKLLDSSISKRISSFLTRRQNFNLENIIERLDFVKKAKRR